jgi:NAD(P)-dependent dehydrogenase (short-subunit alcohol dehydrogenase family)
MTERVALVTGGGTGIGRAISTRLAGDGYRIAVAARRRGPLEEVSAELGGRAYPCDLRHPEQIARLVDDVLSDFGRLDALVNNAGMAFRKAPEDFTVEELETVIETNLYGPILLSQRCIPALRATKGAIVNISSSLATLPQPTQSVYAASKGGLEAFSRVLALELAADGIRVNSVSPAIVRTDIMLETGVDRETAEKYLEMRSREYPLGRLGEPEDVAAVVAYLLSADAVWLTGLTISVDGGRLLGTAPAPR